MTIYYVNGVVGSATAPYDTWAKAAATLATIEAIPWVAGDRVYVASSTALGADHTYSFPAWSANTDPVTVIGTADTTNAPPLTEALVQMTEGTGCDIRLRNYWCIRYIHFTSGGSSTSSEISMSDTDEDGCNAEECIFQLAGTSSSSRIIIGLDSVTANTRARFKNCKFRFSDVAQRLTALTVIDMVGGAVADTGSVPTSVWEGGSSGSGMGAKVRMEAMDLSTCSGNIGGSHSKTVVTYELYGCTMHASAMAALLAAQTNPSGNEITLYNCDVASTGKLYNFYHENYCGKTEISSTIYRTLGATADTSTHYSWKITAKTASTFSFPYRTPWIHVYNTDIATSIQPYLEVIRDGSATAWKDNEFWINGQYPGTATSNLIANVTSRAPYVGSGSTGTNITASALGAGDWSGEGTAWFGKMSFPAAITPASKGHVSIQICGCGSGGGDKILYVDPKLNGLTEISDNYERVTPTGYVNTNIDTAGGTVLQGGAPLESAGYVGDFALSAVVDFDFYTTNPDTLEPYTISGSPAIAIYAGNSSTPVASSGAVLTIDHVTTGTHHVRATVSGANNFAIATNYNARLTAGNVNGTSVVNQVIGSFSVENRAGGVPSKIVNWANLVTGGHPFAGISYNGRVASSPAPSTTTFTMDAADDTPDTGTLAGYEVELYASSGNGKKQSRTIDSNTGKAITFSPALTVAMTGNVDYIIKPRSVTSTTSPPGTDLQLIKTRAINDPGGTVTVPTLIASTTNITAGTITTTTNLTNLPAITANWLTAAGIAADVTTELQAGLATAAALATLQTTANAIGGYVDTEIATLLTELAKVPKSDGVVSLNATAIADIQAGLATSAALAAVSAFVDTEVAAIKAKTDLIPSTPAGVGDIPTTTQIVAAMLTTAITESYRANGAAPTLAQALCEVLGHLSEASIVDTIKTINKFDHVTEAATFTLDDALLPTAITRTS